MLLAANNRKPDGDLGNAYLSPCSLSLCLIIKNSGGGCLQAFISSGFQWCWSQHIWDFSWAFSLMPFVLWMEYGSYNFRCHICIQGEKKVRPWRVWVGRLVSDVSVTFLSGMQKFSRISLNRFLFSCFFGRQWTRGTVWSHGYSQLQRSLGN